MMEEYVIGISVANELLVRDDFPLEDYVKHKLANDMANFIMKDLDKGEPMAHSFTLNRRNNTTQDATDFWIKDRAFPIEARIYVPVYAEVDMPSDLHECKYCSGFTKNDKRGNCLACGAPRGHK